MKTLEIRTNAREEMVDLTADVEAAVTASGVERGLCAIFVPHTTAGVTINENADPDVRRDVLAALRRIVPDDVPYRHGEGNAPAHVKASLVGSSVMVIVEAGRLRLGTWQGIQLCEFDGPRTRQVWVEVISAKPGRAS